MLVESRNVKEHWDFLESLRPPADMSIANHNPYRIVEVARNSIEFQYVAYKFLHTFNGRKPELNNIKRTFELISQQGLPADAQRV